MTELIEARAEVADRARREADEYRGDNTRPCPFCLDVWVATAFVTGMVFAPRFTRLTTGIFTVLAGADFLQLGYAVTQRWAEGSQDSEG